MKFKFEHIISGKKQDNYLTIIFEEDLFNDPEYAIGCKKLDDFLTEFKRELEKYKDKMFLEYQIKINDHYISAKSNGFLCYNITKVPEIIDMMRYNNFKAFIDAIAQATIEVFTGKPPVKKRKPYIQDGCPSLSIDARGAGSNLQECLTKDDCYSCLGLHIFVDEKHKREVTSCPLEI